MRRNDPRAWSLLGVLVALGCTPPEAIAPGNGNTIPEAGFVHRSGTTLVDGAGDAVLPRCTNIDSWLHPIPYLVSDAGTALFTSPTDFRRRLDDVVGATEAEAFWNDWEDAFFTEADVERMAALGFNCARVVLYHRAITREGEAGLELHEPTLERLDRALEWGLDHDVYMVLDLHTAPGSQNGVATVGDIPAGSDGYGLWQGSERDENQAQTIELWGQLARRYAGHRQVMAYDLLNEPVLPPGVDKSDLPDLYGRIIDAIRAEDPDHLVFLEGDALAHDFSMFSAPLDDNQGYAFHAYALTGFEDWATPEKRDLQPYLDLRDDHERPIWLGEFGEERLDWQVGVIDVVEEEQVGWALYPWKRKQTWFFNPVLQRIDPTPKWYALARYLTGDRSDPPSDDKVEAALAEVLDAVRLESCREDGELANALPQAR